VSVSESAIGTLRLIRASAGDLADAGERDAAPLCGQIALGIVLLIHAGNGCKGATVSFGPVAGAEEEARGLASTCPFENARIAAKDGMVLVEIGAL
jgi:hypothetical protein